MDGDRKQGNVKGKPVWLLALVPLLGIVLGAWFVAKFLA